MAADVESEPVQAPEALERGRYAVYETPDGGLAIARSGPLCGTCQGCGCGDQADPILVPAMAVTAWKAMQNGDRMGALAKVKAMMRRG